MASNGDAADFPPPASCTPASDADFERFLELADNDEGWTEKYTRGPGSGIWTRLNKGSTINMMKARVDYEDVEASVLYDVLHDPYYRRVWDDNMVDGFEICQIDARNDIGYYSLRFPTPLANRDYVNQRSWRVFDNQYIIFNHSVVHPKLPERPSFVRAVSFLSGFVIRAQEKGCRFYYITHNDPKGMIPSFIINRVITRVVPRLGDRIRAACLAYPAWKDEHQPSFKPWLGPTASDELPDFDTSLTRDLVDSKGKLLVKSTSELGMNLPKVEVKDASGDGEEDQGTSVDPEQPSETDI